MQNPELLIRVIAGIQMLPIHNLGWDTSMTVVERFSRSLDRKRVLSYQVDFDYKTYTWAIPMPKPDPHHPGQVLASGTEKFVMADELSTYRAEVVKGRATRIWKAWKLEHMRMAVNERPVSLRLLFACRC